MDQKKVIRDPNQLFLLKDQIKNIILDFGGVLFDIDYQLPIAAFKRLGLKNFESYYHQGAQSELFDRLETGDCSTNEFITTLKNDLPKETSSEQIISAWNAILIGIKKERIAKVHQLKKGYRTFLLSNTNEIHVESFEKRVIEVMGEEFYTSAFEKIYYSNELGLRKPHPETFKKVCDNHQLLPSETLFIDDSFQHVEGAASAGLYAFHLDLKRCDFLEAFELW